MVEKDGDLLPKDGSKSMKGNLNMTDSRGNKHSIIGLKDPKASDASYAASVNFVNNTVNGSNVIINGIIDKKNTRIRRKIYSSNTARKCFRKSYGRRPVYIR